MLIGDVKILLDEVTSMQIAGLENLTREGWNNKYEIVVGKGSTIEGT